jgi:hypothetical protein
MAGNLQASDNSGDGDQEREASAMRAFPIQTAWQLEPSGIQQRDWIPLELIEPHDEQARRNHGNQSLFRLAQRGGLSACEAVAVIEDKGFYEYWKGGWNRPWIESQLTAVKRLDELCAKYDTPTVGQPNERSMT